MQNKQNGRPKKPFGGKFDLFFAHPTCGGILVHRAVVLLIQRNYQRQLTLRAAQEYYATLAKLHRV